MSLPKKTAKLSALNRAMANFRSKCGYIWSICKQVWYIPFLWSLAWYSYWICHSIIALKTPVLQGNIMDYIGAVLSVVALLVAGYRSRKPIRRSMHTASVRLSFHKSQSEKNGQQSPYAKPAQSILSGNVKQNGNQQPKHQQPINPSPLQKEIMLTQKTPPSASMRVPKGISSQSGRGPTCGDIDSECLTCPNLIGCTNRQKRAMELTSQGENRSPCSYAEQVSSKHV